MTRAELLRRLAEALDPHDTGGPITACLVGAIPDIFDALRALAREPGGAEAVSEAVGIEPICDCCDCEGCASKQRVVAAEEPGK